MGRISFPVGPNFRVSDHFRTRVVELVRWMFQRLPIFTHFCVMLLAVIGPVMAPRLLGVFFLTVQTILTGTQVRSAWGQYQCWVGGRAHCQTDWVLYWSDQKAKLDRDGLGHSILPHDAVQHLILIPAYKEDMSTLKETIGVLASHPLAASSYRVCLGMEEREAGAAKKAETLVAFYRAQRVFLEICYSMHPGTIVGESAGKSSNINWAARFMAKRVPVSQHERCVVTVMDSDTCFAADYFLAISAKYSLLSIALRRTTMFVPPILFDRNGPDVPVLTRLADVFWCCAGAGGIYPGSAAKIPTSAYSVSLELAKFCNFWDAGPEAIGEDKHFYVKGMFETKGHINAITIYSPASQMHVVGAPASSPVLNYLSDMKARYSQAVRHMWGSLDFGYAWGRIVLGQFGPSVRHPTYVAIDQDGSVNGMGGAGEMDADDAEAVKSLFEAKLKAAEDAGLVRAVSPAGESVITESSVTSGGAADMFGMTRAKKFTSIDSPVTPHHPHHSHLMAGSGLISPAPKPGVVKPPSDDDNDSDFDAMEDDSLFNRDRDGLDSRPDTPLYSSVEEKGVRIFPFIVVMMRLYEAHLLIVHFLMTMGILACYPTVIFQDGSVSYSIPEKAYTLASCWEAFTSRPYASRAGVEAANSWIQSTKTPIWVMPDVVLCSKQIASVIGAVGVVCGAMMFLTHDLYHHVCATERWRQSENIRQIVLRERHRQGAITSTDRPSDMPARYLGIRPSQTCIRKWPIVWLDFLALPVALSYAFVPLIWAQLNHIVTNQLAYTVSAKGKGIVVSTRIPAGESVEVHGRRWSVEHHRIASSNQELAVAVPMEMGYLPKPATAS